MPRQLLRGWYDCKSTPQDGNTYVYVRTLHVCVCVSMCRCACVSFFVVCVLSLCMYVRMYVCICVYMCMYVCMYATLSQHQRQKKELRYRFSTISHLLFFSIFFDFFIQIIKITKKHLFLYFCPSEGNFDIDAGDGVGEDHLGPPKIHQNLKKYFVRKLFTLLGHFPKM